MEEATRPTTRHKEDEASDLKQSRAKALLEKKDPYRQLSIANSVPASLLALLDDKNKSIITLKRQIHHQKLQLGFYLHKVLNSPKVSNLADTCLPCEADDNLQVNLAMSRFCRKTGTSSRIMGLHDRMNAIEESVRSVVRRQDAMVHAIVTKIAELARDASANSKTREFLTELREDKADLLAKILGSNNRLRKELDLFRTCCERLVVIEDERNSLVEHVYSLPVRKRLNYGVLLAAQCEKLRIEKEVDEIRHEQRLLQLRLSRMDSPTMANNRVSVEVAEGRIEEDAESAVTAAPAKANEEFTDGVQQLLENVNSDAVSLVSTAISQNDKYQEEINRLREDNEELGRKLGALRERHLTSDDLEERLRIAREEFEEMQQQKNSEFSQLNAEVRSLAEEREFLQTKLQHYYEMEAQVEALRTKILEVDEVTRERDYYKSQVEDLQSIRTAYIQMMETFPPAENEANKHEIKTLLFKVMDLEGERQKMSEEIGRLGSVIKDQEAQIKQLLIIIKEVANQWDEARRPDATYTQKEEVREKKGALYEEKHHDFDIEKLDEEKPLVKSKSSQTFKSFIQETSRPTKKCVNVQLSDKKISMRSIYETPKASQSCNQLSLAKECQTNFEEECENLGLSKESAINNQNRTPSKITTINLSKNGTDMELLTHSCNDENLLISLPKYSQVTVFHIRSAEIAPEPVVAEKTVSNTTERSLNATERTILLPPCRVVSEVSENGNLLLTEGDDNRTILPPVENGSNVDITTRLKQLTSELGYTLSLPGGREALLSSVKHLYGTLFTSSDEQ